MNNLKRKEILILIFCLLLGFGLRFYTFDQKSLWTDEIHTFNDASDSLSGRLKFYKENSAYLHPPLFFILTHSFYPFDKPERDLRIIPLIFGTLSIPMLYLLSRSFSLSIALPCTLSLIFMAYHISLSQEGRAYSLLMFLGITGLYFFIKHLHTSRKRYLVLVALFFSILFYTSYSSIPFIALSQLLWLYKPRELGKKPTLSSFFLLNGLILLFCLPWIMFVALNYKGQSIMNPFHVEGIGSFWSILYGILNDWVPYLPLMIVSAIALILFPFFSKPRMNAIVLLTALLLPITGLYSFCRAFNIGHFITSRYLINFLPLFLITLYLSIEAIERKFEKLRTLLRLKLIFLLLLIASNLVILPLYYRSEKQDLRGLVTYLKNHLEENDKIFIGSIGYIQGILHYFESFSKNRHHLGLYPDGSGREIEFRMSFTYRNKIFTVYQSTTCCNQYVADGSRLWIIVPREMAKEIKDKSPCVLKGYFDGSFLNFNRFPTDASMYLFLWDPKFPGEKGIEMPIE